MRSCSRSVLRHLLLCLDFEYQLLFFLYCGLSVNKSVLPSRSNQRFNPRNCLPNQNDVICTFRVRIPKVSSQCANPNLRNTLLHVSGLSRYRGTNTNTMQEDPSLYAASLHLFRPHTANYSRCDPFICISILSTCPLFDNFVLTLSYISTHCQHPFIVVAY